MKQQVYEGATVAAGAGIESGRLASRGVRGLARAAFGLATRPFRSGPALDTERLDELGVPDTQRQALAIIVGEQRMPVLQLGASNLVHQIVHEMSQQEEADAIDPEACEQRFVRLASAAGIPPEKAASIVHLPQPQQVLRRR